MEINEKIWFMLASVVVLNLYLNYNHIREFLSGDVMGAKVLSMEEIDELCEGREEIRGEAPITLNGGKIAYDEEQNMLLIPQSFRETLRGGFGPERAGFISHGTKGLRIRTEP